MPRIHRELLVTHRGRHVDAVSNAMRVSDDQAGTVVRLGFEERLQRVLVLRSHGDTGYVHISVAHRHQAKIFFGGRFASGGKLGYRSPWSGFGRLPPLIGVTLGIEPQEVDFESTGQQVIEPAVANVISPA